jgi:DNA-binding NarL/FixJ family response regulator
MATPINILLIEDSPEIREVLGQSVVASGNMRLIGTADSAEAAIRLIDVGNIDAAVIDLDLRGSSGLAVLAYLGFATAVTLWVQTIF